jgi:hypothetical protein
VHFLGKAADAYNKLDCHTHARDVFDSLTMAKKYVLAYEKVLNGHFLSQSTPHLLEKDPAKFLPWNKKSL